MKLWLGPSDLICEVFSKDGAYEREIIDWCETEQFDSILEMILLNITFCPSAVYICSIPVVSLRALWQIAYRISHYS